MLFVGTYKHTYHTTACAHYANFGHTCVGKIQNKAQEQYGRVGILVLLLFLLFMELPLVVNVNLCLI